MNKDHRSSFLNPDWFIRARRHDFRLTPQSPLFAYDYEFQHITPMLIDLHTGIEIGLVLDGQQVRQFDDLEITVGPGDVWLCAAWEPHGWLDLTPSGRVMAFIFLPEFLGEECFEGLSWINLFAVPPQERPRASSDELRNSILKKGWKLQREINERRPGWMTAVRLDLLRILFDLSRGWNPGPSRKQSPAFTCSLTRVMPALTMFQADPGRVVSLSEAAAACGLSRSRFVSIFRNATGTSFAKFHLRARLAYVAHRLLTTDLTLQKIATEAGFVDASHLNRTFLQHYARTPGQYREQMR